MKSFAITILIIVIVSVFVLWAISFQVRQTEHALVTRFGKAVRTYKDAPGFKLKWPVPIETVHKFDSRLRLYEAELGETTTKGAKPIIVNTFIVWRIAEPLQFFNAVGTVAQAQSKLRSQISNTQNTIIGRHEFSEFINADPNLIRFDEIQDEMLADIRPGVLKDYGIEIETVGIKQLKVSEDVSKGVFARMRAERDRITLAVVSEGDAEATRIMSQADAEKIEILAAAERRAKVIKGQGDAEAAQYYELYREDEPFAIFLLNLDALTQILKERSTIVFSADTEPFKLLRGIPDIEPVETNPSQRR